MLRIFAVTLLAIALSVGFAQAKHTGHVHKHTKATRHVQTNAIPLKNEGQWCRTFAQPSEMQPFGSALPGQAKGTVYQIAEVARNLRTKSPQRCALPPSMIAHSHLLRFPWAGPSRPKQSQGRPGTGG